MKSGHVINELAEEVCQMLAHHHLHLAHEPQEWESVRVTHTTVRKKSSNCKAPVERLFFLNKRGTYNSN